MNLDHPVIKKMERDGYLVEDKPQYYDFFGHPIYTYDNYFEFDDDKFLSEELPQEAKEILVHLGATQKVCATNTDK